MSFTRKPVKARGIASYCRLCDQLVAATKSRPKKMLKLLDTMERLHHCRGQERSWCTVETEHWSRKPSDVFQHLTLGFRGSDIFSGDKIKELCARVIAAEGQEFEAALADLRALMRKHSEDLHNRTLATVLKFPRPVRKKDGTEG